MARRVVVGENCSRAHNIYSVHNDIRENFLFLWEGGKMSLRSWGNSGFFFMKISCHDKIDFSLTYAHCAVHKEHFDGVSRVWHIKFPHFPNSTSSSSSS